jgi:hypothetical protein
MSQWVSYDLSRCGTLILVVTSMTPSDSGEHAREDGSESGTLADIMIPLMLPLPYM